MSQNPQKRVSPAAPDLDAAAKGALALSAGRFKEAMDLFRGLVRQDPKPEWRAALNQAYAGRAAALWDKGMFKEAAIVLENTAGPDGSLADPVFYLRCLIRAGQGPKAAEFAAGCIGRGAAEAADTRRSVEDAAAALYLLHPGAFAKLAASKHPPAIAWAEAAKAAGAALAAHTAGADDVSVDGLLSKISLRSAFGPVRLILKSLSLLRDDRAKAGKLIAGIDPTSVFFPFRSAIETMLASDDLPMLAAGGSLTPAGRSLAVEMLGLSGPALQGLTRLVEAEQGGPATLLSFLLKARDLPRGEARSASLNLLPQAPDRVHLFDKAFEPLTPFERHRIAALAAEARSDWHNAEISWRRCCEALKEPLKSVGDREARLSLGVIYRHLSELASKHREIQENFFGDEEPSLAYLKRSVEADPHRLVTTIALMDAYRDEGDIKEWGQLAQEAAQRFPTERAVLLHAMEAAVARNALKLASGFGRKLLTIDPINQQARRSMIDLGLGQARKQLKAKRPDLATKQIEDTAQWERADRPSPELRIARGLVRLAVGEDPAACAALVQEGVALAGGGVAAWLRAGVEADLMRIPPAKTAFVNKGLAEARAAAPSKTEMVAVAKVFGVGEGKDKDKDKSAKPSNGITALFKSLRPWFSKAAALDWSADEVHMIADLFRRFKAFDLLGDYAHQGLVRRPEDPSFVLYRMIARTKGSSDRMKFSDRMTVEDLIEDAMERADLRFIARVQRYLEGETSPSRPRRMPAMPQKTELEAPDSMFLHLLDGMFSDLKDETPPAYLARIGRARGRKAALDDIMQRFRQSALSNIMDEDMAHQLFNRLIGEILQNQHQF